MLCLSLRRSDVVEVGPRHVKKTAEHPDGVLDDYQPVKRDARTAVTSPCRCTLIWSPRLRPCRGDRHRHLSAHRPRQGVHGERFRRPDARLVRRGEVPPMIDATGKSKNIASHGLRKLCLVRLAEAGCDVIECRASAATRICANANLHRRRQPQESGGGGDHETDRGAERGARGGTK